MRKTYASGLLGFALALCQPVWADRAVIVGIGNYNDTRIHSLPGIDHDITTAQQLAHVFGFSDAQLTVLSDGQATLDRVQREIHAALSATRNERVFIYFSGHGTHVLDDGGKRDGALVMANF